MNDICDHIDATHTTESDISGNQLRIMGHEELQISANDNVSTHEQTPTGIQGVDSHQGDKAHDENSDDNDDISYDNESVSQASSITATSLKISKGQGSIPTQIMPEANTDTDATCNQEAAETNAQSNAGNFENVTNHDGYFDNVPNDIYEEPDTLAKDGAVRGAFENVSNDVYEHANAKDGFNSEVFDAVPDDDYEEPEHTNTAEDGFDSGAFDNVHVPDDTYEETEALGSAAAINSVEDGAASGALEGIPDDAYEEEEVIDAAVTMNNAQDGVFKNIPNDVYEEVPDPSIGAFENVPDTVYSDDVEDKGENLVNAFEDVPGVAYRDKTEPEAIVPALEGENNDEMTSTSVENVHATRTVEVEKLGAEGDVQDNISHEGDDSFGAFEATAESSAAVEVNELEKEPETTCNSPSESQNNIDIEGDDSFGAFEDTTYSIAAVEVDAEAETANVEDDVEEDKTEPANIQNDVEEDGDDGFGAFEDTADSSADVKVDAEAEPKNIEDDVQEDKSEPANIQNNVEEDGDDGFGAFEDTSDRSAAVEVDAEAETANIEDNVEEDKTEPANIQNDVEVIEVDTEAKTKSPTEIENHIDIEGDDSFGAFEDTSDSSAAVEVDAEAETANIEDDVEEDKTELANIQNDVEEEGDGNDSGAFEDVTEISAAVEVIEAAIEAEAKSPTEIENHIDIEGDDSFGAFEDTSVSSAAVEVDAETDPPNIEDDVEEDDSDDFGAFEDVAASNTADQANIAKEETEAPAKIQMDVEEDDDGSFGEFEDVAESSAVVEVNGENAEIESQSSDDEEFGEFGEFEESTQGGVVDDIGNQQTPFILKASSVFHSIFKSSETESEVIVEDSNADLDVISIRGVLATLHDADWSLNLSGSRKIHLDKLFDHTTVKENPSNVFVDERCPIRCHERFDVDQADGFIFHFEEGLESDELYNVVDLDLPTLSDAAPTIDTTNMPKTAPTTDIPTNQASVIPDDDDPTNFKASPRNHTSSSSFHDGSTQQQSANIETNDPFDNEKSSTEIDAERPHIAAATIVKIPEKKKKVLSSPDDAFEPENFGDFHDALSAQKQPSEYENEGLDSFKDATSLTTNSHGGDIFSVFDNAFETIHATSRPTFQPVTILPNTGGVQDIAYELKMINAIDEDESESDESFGDFEEFQGPEHHNDPPQESVLQDEDNTNDEPSSDSDTPTSLSLNPVAQEPTLKKSESTEDDAGGSLTFPTATVEPIAQSENSSKVAPLNSLTLAPTDDDGMRKEDLTVDIDPLGQQAGIQESEITEEVSGASAMPISDVSEFESESESDESFGDFEEFQGPEHHNALPQESVLQDVDNTNDDPSSDSDTPTSLSLNSVAQETALKKSESTEDDAGGSPTFPTATVEPIAQSENSSKVAPLNSLTLAPTDDDGMRKEDLTVDIDPLGQQAGIQESEITEEVSGASAMPISLPTHPFSQEPLAQTVDTTKKCPISTTPIDQLIHDSILFTEQMANGGSEKPPIAPAPAPFDPSAQNDAFAMPTVTSIDQFIQEPSLRTTGGIGNGDPFGSMMAPAVPTPVPAPFDPSAQNDAFAMPTVTSIDQLIQEPSLHTGGIGNGDPFGSMMPTTAPVDPFANTMTRELQTTGSDRFVTPLAVNGTSDTFMPSKHVSQISPAKNTSFPEDGFSDDEFGEFCDAPTNDDASLPDVRYDSGVMLNNPSGSAITDAFSILE